MAHLPRGCAVLLRGTLPQKSSSIMPQYAPQHRAAGCPGINRLLTAREYDEVTNHALEPGLKNARIQELDSHHRYFPDFDRNRSFDQSRSPSHHSPSRVARDFLKNT